MAILKQLDIIKKLYRKKYQQYKIREKEILAELYYSLQCLRVSLVEKVSETDSLVPIIMRNHK